MKFETVHSSKIPILEIEGKIIGEAVMALKSEIKKQVNKSEGRLILDLSDVPLMDSSALGMIVATLQELKRENGKLVLLNPQKSVSNVLSITRLDSIFEVYRDEKKAIESFNDSN
jgi:anti-sigma B factor antagonist